MTPPARSCSAAALAGCLLLSGPAFAEPTREECLADIRERTIEAVGAWGGATGAAATGAVACGPALSTLGVDLFLGYGACVAVSGLAGWVGGGWWAERRIEREKEACLRYPRSMI